MLFDVTKFTNFELTKNTFITELCDFIANHSINRTFVEYYYSNSILQNKNYEINPWDKSRSRPLLGDVFQLFLAVSDELLDFRNLRK